MDLEIVIYGCVAAVLVGMAKNGVPGLGILVVPIMAMAFPVKQSVGTLLPMLITGDILAIIHFRRHAQWNKLWGLFPWVIVGGALGTWTLIYASELYLKPMLGVLVLVMLVLELLRSRFAWRNYARHRFFTAGFGTAAGFSTTVGNVAGPVMSMYLLGKEMPKEQFVGTAAWFFFLVNLSKVPIFLSLHMITRESLVFDLKMAPLVVVGGLLGVRVFQFMPQKVFTGMILVLTALAALRLLF
jgi:uncharacterized membrane protein YfcA